MTFIEDALRIITQWNDQLTYLGEFRNSQDSPPLLPIPGAINNSHRAC